MHTHTLPNKAYKYRPYVPKHRQTTFTCLMTCPKIITDSHYVAPQGMIKFSKRKTTSQFIYPVHGVILPRESSQAHFCRESDLVIATVGDV